MKVLYFTSIMPDAQNGGNMGMERNLEMAIASFGKENVFTCALHIPSKLQGLRNFMLDRSFYHSSVNNSILKDAINNGPYDFIFLNGPLVYKFIKPFISDRTCVYLYCHNVDYDYFWNKYVLSRKISDYLMARYIKRMEKYIVNKATIVSTLNERDALSLHKHYGKKPDFILPIAMDEMPEAKLQSYAPQETYGLFVGSSIGPNIEGLEWFFNKVAPFTPGVQYKIVGTCCEFFKDKTLPCNITLCGKVNDLDGFYKNASFVICPIFSGSGMKTKTIEALRYGKTIIGTSEAFEGIHVDYDSVGIKSDKAEDQITRINSLDKSVRLNRYSLDEFKRNFTYEVVFDRFKNYILKIKL